MNKQLSFNTNTGELEYLGYSISIQHNIGYESDYSYSYIEYVASHLHEKDFDIVDESLSSILETIEHRVKLITRKESEDEQT